MKKVYYTLWVDALISTRSLPKNKYMWKFYTMLFMSLCMALNLSMIILLIKKIFNDLYYDIPIDLFLGDKLDFMIRFILLYLLPVLFINYILIFYNNKHEFIEKKYNYNNGKYYIAYIIVSNMIPLIVFLIYFIEQLINK